ncbi:hypothetical protein AB0F15_00330 [Amycolatopsis sp. NPDC026612]|uniref:hypothetical protein n=1 Tax=Amycolatopsis sp. NPDC026612 TaxID=3155466 RepID=UPI0034080EDD
MLGPSPSETFGFLTCDTEAEALGETRSLAQVRPGVLESVAELAAAVVADDTLAPLLAAEGDELCAGGAC